MARAIKKETIIGDKTIVRKEKISAAKVDPKQKILATHN
jgi:hypothetical protein